MSIIQAIILGIIEGITEFLPISSTGHLILANHLLGISDSNFTKSFEIFIQLGAILAVVVIYWKKIFSSVEIWKKIMTAFLPTAILGFILYKLIKKFLLSNELVVVLSLFIGGIILIVFEVWYKSKSRKKQEIDYKKSFIIGVAQSLAMIPGLSRSAATIVGGLLLGISREDIVEFSFLLAIPTMAAATGFDLLKSAGSFSFDQFYFLVIGFVVSFLVALVSIKWMINFVKKHTFISFGIYRVFIALLFWNLMVK